MKLFLIALCALSGCASSHDEMMRDLVQGPPEIGEPPSRAAGTALLETAVKASLKDPDSAQFTWPNGFMIGWYKPSLSARIHGYYTCGTVNAKNGYGGYSGRQAVVGVIANGQVVYFDIDSGPYSIVAGQCAKAGVPAF